MYELTEEKLNKIKEEFKGNLVEYIEQLKQKAELGEHYKHLYSEVKKQKDDVVEYIKHYINFRKDIYPYIDMREFDLDKLLRMLGEIDVED